VGRSSSYTSSWLAPARRGHQQPPPQRRRERLDGLAQQPQVIGRGRDDHHRLMPGAGDDDLLMVVRNRVEGLMALSSSDIAYTVLPNRDSDLDC
jgi:hypothetical protein